MFLNEITLIASSIVFVLTTALFYLYYKNPRNNEFLHAALFFLCCAIVIYCEYYLRLVSEPTGAVFWSKILYVTVAGFIYTFPLFTTTLDKKDMSRNMKIGLGSLSIICIVIIGLTDYLITSEAITLNNVMQAKKGLFYPILIIVLLLIGGGYYVKAMLVGKSSTRGLNRTPLLLGTGLALILCCIDVIGTMLNKPLISGLERPYILGLFIIAISFAWVFLSQYSWIFANLTKTRQEVERLTAKSNRDFVEFVQLIAKTLDAKDHYTAGHSLRVMDYAVRVAKILNLTEQDIEMLKQACLLHDIGKISIPDGILNKKKPLTKKDRDYIIKHPEIGKKILSTVGEFKEILDIIYSHHERVDGKGYPEGIRKDSIPLLARILAVADTYDAMRSERPYRGAKTKEHAIDELNKVKGSQLDENIVDKFIASIID